MNISHLSFLLHPSHITPQSYAQLHAEFPACKYGFKLSRLPSATFAQELNVAHAAASSVQTLDDNDPAFKIVLDGEALEEFLLTGTSAALQSLLDHSPRPIFDALQLELPDHPLKSDLTKLVNTINALPFPVIFRRSLAHAPLFDALSLNSKNLAPLLPFALTQSDTSFPIPFSGLATGYQLDGFNVLPSEWVHYLESLEKLIPAGTPFIWMDLDWSSELSYDAVSVIRSFYKGAVPYLEGAASVV